MYKPVCVLCDNTMPFNTVPAEVHKQDHTISDSDTESDDRFGHYTSTVTRHFSKPAGRYKPKRIYDDIESGTSSKISKKFKDFKHIKKAMGGQQSDQQQLRNEEQPHQEDLLVRKPKPKPLRNTEFSRFLNDRRLSDLKKYRDGYPDKWDNERLKDNYLFYMNKLKCRPDGCYIDTIHQSWWGQYDKLEKRHGYIQWLFPLRESGMNCEAQDLQQHEAKKIQESPEAMTRVVMSYRLMLDFYGIELIEGTTGEVRRTPEWRSRLTNLNLNGHNYLRITRILKSLGEFGLEHFKPHLIQFFLFECLICGTVPNIYDSCNSYWIETVKDSSKREELLQFVQDNMEECVEAD